MASTSKMDIDGEDEDQEEELERFDDFTLASSWERFISEIEAVCRQWLANGPKNLLEKGAVCLGFSNNLYKVKSQLKYAMKSYCMEYYFESNNDGKLNFCCYHPLYFGRLLHLYLLDSGWPRKSCGLDLHFA
ncbi:hypothetical protein L1049_014022 [Liquidambar formosana]|uniref:Rab3 GTPase-activating protein catalytic subunit n=1 Tax=Liquidambar formosana TaxID=63359 RepID=A0AAP0RLK2_LIQFO